MKQNLPKIIFGVVFLAIIIATWRLYSGQEEERWFGYAEGEYVRVAVPDSGTLETLSVYRGDQVKKGDPLFTLESVAEHAAVAEAKGALAEATSARDNLLKGLRDSEIDALLRQRDQAAADYELAAKTLERQYALFDQGHVSQAAVDDAQARYETAEARVEQLEAQLVTAKLPARADEIAAANARIDQAKAALDKADFLLSKRAAEAPDDALVFDTFYRVGEYVGPSQPVVSLLPPENVKVRFFIPEAALAELTYGQSLVIQCDNCGEGVQATVTFISPDAEFTPPVIYSEDARQKLVFMIEAKPVDPAGFPLKPGQPVEVLLP